MLTFLKTERFGKRLRLGKLNVLELENVNINVQILAFQNVNVLKTFKAVIQISY